MKRNQSIPTEDDYTPLRHRIWELVLASPIAASLTPASRKYLETRINVGDPDVSRFLTVNFTRAGTTCSLDVEAGRFGEFKFVDDEQGNSWRVLDDCFDVVVNHPCHGSTDAAICLARAELYREVCMLGCTLKAELDGQRVAYVYKTADEKSRDAERARDRAREKALRDFVLDCIISNRKQLLFEGPKIAVSLEEGTRQHDILQDVPCGTYTVTVADGRGDGRSMCTFEVEIVPAILDKDAPHALVHRLD